MKTDFSKSFSEIKGGKGKIAPTNDRISKLNVISDDGSPELQTALSMILNSDLPMVLFWGKDLNFFYNKSFHSLFGGNDNEYHQTGQIAIEYLKTNWKKIIPHLQEVLTTGRSMSHKVKLNSGDFPDLKSLVMHYNPIKNPEEKTQGVVAIYEEQNTDEHFKGLLNTLPVAIYICDAQGYISFYNAASVELWGKAPEIGKDQWCGSWKIYNPDGSELPIDQCPMAIAIREGHEVADREIVIERIDGTRLNILPRPKPIFNKSGDVIGAINTLIDITAVKKTETDLRLSEDRLRLATEGTRIATWDLNLVTHEIHHSKRLAHIFGFEGERKLTQEELHKYIHPDDLKEIVETAFNLALTTGIYYYEARIIHPDKSIHWIRTHGKIVFDDNHIPKRMLGTMQDISEEKIAEEKVAMLAAIVHSSNDAIISKRLDGTITSWNTSAERIFGYTAEEIVGQNISKLIPPERIDEEAQIIAQLKKGEIVDHFVTQRISKDRKMHDISLTISPVVDKEGSLIGASKIARDISKQKADEMLVKESEQKFRLLADNLAQFTWTCDQSGKINYVNNSILAYSGLSIEKIFNEGLFQLLHPNEKEEDQILWGHSLKKGKDFLLEQRFKRKDGQFRWHMTRIIPQKDSSGMIQMWVGTSMDIHDRKVFTETLESQVRNRTRELNQSNSDLRKSNNELVEFAYVASHDLQEPLRKIQTFATRILQKDKDNLSVSGKDYFERMQGAANRMQTLIEDLLSYSRTNTANKTFVSVDLNGLINEVQSELEGDIAEKKAILNIQRLPVAKIIPFQFHQLFTNLISNSLKFSREDVRPVINISSSQVNGRDLKYKQADPLIAYNKISISDNGIGFHPEFNDRIFDLFYRLHGRSEYTGTGIGLAICKKIIENHNGFIVADGEENQGASFHLFLPVAE